MMLLARMFSERPGNARLQAANAANDKIDRNARKARLVKSVDNVGLDERVELHPDGGLPACFTMSDLGVNFLDNPGLDAMR